MLLRLWCETSAGPPDQFWRQTPRRLSLILAGRRKAAETEHIHRAWLAYNTALLPLMKRPPTFAKLAGIQPKPDLAPQTPEQMQANLDKWFR